MHAPYAPRWLDLSDGGAAAAWDALVAASPYGTPFSRSAYARAAAEAFGLRPRLLAVERDGALAGGVVVFEKRRGPFRLGVVPPLTPYTPVVLAEPLDAADLPARTSPLDALLPALDGAFHAQALHLHPAMGDVRPFQWAGWDASPRYTFAGPLAEADAMRRDASKAVRKLLRRHDADFRFAEEPDAAALVEQLAQASEGATDHAAAGRRRAFLRALPEPLLRLFVLRHAGDGTPAAALSVVTDGRTAYFVSGGSAPGPAMTVLTFRLWERLHAEGHAAVEVVGANMASIAEFKRRLGLPMTTYYRVQRVRRPALRLLAAFRPVV